MAKPLPMSFRINMHNKSQEYLQSMKTVIDKYFAKWGNKLVDFYSKDQDLQTTYNFTISRNELRNAKNNQTDQELQQQLNVIHKFIVLMDESGYIQRQEYVSQIPPKLLQPQKGDKILDMCAAPGSKTSQLLEAVGIDGLVIGNDADLKRTHILMHNVTSNACVPQLLLTNLDAAKYPYMNLENDRILEFDRIQADVPCSGDGTLRKNIDAIYSWTLQQATSLNSLQKQILIRAIQLVKNGGYVTYSTCSLNPLEDEAVVSAVINEFNNTPELGVKIEICDPKEIIPHSNYAKGMAQWPVIYNDEILPDYDHCSEDVKKHINKDFYPTNNLPQLVNCCRFYPWLQNSGGFFVALLKITKPDNFYNLLNNLTQQNPGHNLITKVMKKSLDYKKQLLGNLKSFSAAESRRIPLNAQRRINEEYKQQIQNKFNFSQLFETENIQQSLNNLSVRETEKGTQSFQHVYIQSPYVSQILFSHSYGFELYHIVQAGIQFLHHRNGSYQIETEASYTYDYTKYTYKLNIFIIIELLINPELSLTFAQIQEEIKNRNYSQQIQDQTKSEIDLIHQNVMSQSVNIQAYCTQTQLQELKQIEDFEYVSQIIDDVINIFNGMKISAFIGKNSIGLNLKKQHKKCLECLLLGEKIEEIVQRNNGKKLSYRQRKEQKRNMQRALKKEEQEQ